MTQGNATTYSPAAPSPQPEPCAVVRPCHLTVYCFGTFCVYQNDRFIDQWNGLKGQAILKFLVAHQGRPVAREVLMETFWPESPPDAARRNLHQAVYSLRRTLRENGPDFHHVLFANDCYMLNPEMSLWVDCLEFENQVQKGRLLAARDARPAAMAAYGIAESLYQGDFLADDLYEEWHRPQQEMIRRQYLEITNCLSAYYFDGGDVTAALALCQKLLAQDHCHEEAHRRLMRCYLAQGQRYMAVRQYQVCVEALQDELGLQPAAATRELYRRLVSGSPLE